MDQKKALWTIPVARMKGAREHRVPLSGAALGLPQSLTDDRADQPTAAESPIFPSTKAGKPLSGVAMAMLLHPTCSDVTVHGLRSAFRDWASETTGLSHVVCEMALAHTIGNKADAAYRRAVLLLNRCELMEAWAVYRQGGEQATDAPPMS